MGGCLMNKKKYYWVLSGINLFEGADLLSIHYDLLGFDNRTTA